MLCNQHVFRINALRMRRFRGTSMKAWRCDFDKHGVGAALSAFHSPKWKATQKSEKKGPPRKDERCPRGKIFKSDFNSFVFSSLISMKLCDFCERFEPIAADCNSFHHEVGVSRAEFARGCRFYGFQPRIFFWKKSGELIWCEMIFKDHEMYHATFT